MRQHFLESYINKILLTEGIADVKKYYPNIEDETFYKLIALDPTYKEGVDKVGTYGKWILNLYKQNKLKEEDFYKVTEYLTEFEENKKWFNNKDIGQFKTLPDLYDALKNVVVGELSKNQKDKQFKKEIKKSDLNAEVVYEDEEWIVYVPNDYETSCKLSSNTEWCTGISSKGDDYYYNMYSNQGPLYILHNKKDGNDKYQFHFESSQFMDASDRPIDLARFLDKKATEGLADFIIKKSLAPYYKELKIDDDTPNDAEITFTMSYSDFIYMLDDVKDSDSGWGHDEKLSGETAAKILEDPYDFFWDSGDYVTLNDLSWYESNSISDRLKEKLATIGINANTVGDLINYARDDSNEYCDEVNNGIIYAASDAIASGSSSVAQKDVMQGIRDCFDAFKTDINYDQFTLIGTKKTFSGLILQYKEIDEDDTYDSRNKVASIIYHALCDRFEVYEPRYGWNDFDEEVFLSSLEDRLMEELPV